MSAACRIDHAKLRADERQWSKLKSIGVSMGLDYRNCPSCHSTICKPVKS